MIFHCPIYVRAGDTTDSKEDRVIEFVASSGNPVRTYGGLEYLRVSGLSLDRFRKNPVVLDCHNRTSADDVIGRATVRKDEGKLIASIKFASDPKSDRIYQKLKDGILSAVSIGFSVSPDCVRELDEGETDGCGDDEIRGPGIVLNKSELHEISVVPVPADEDALRREFYERCQVKYPTRAGDSMTKDPKKDPKKGDEDEDERGECECDPDEECECGKRESDEDDCEDERASGRKVSRPKSKFKSAREAWADIAKKTGLTPKDVDKKDHDATTWRWILKEGRSATAGVINLEVERLRLDAEISESRLRARTAIHNEIRGVCPEPLLAFLDGLLLRSPGVSFDDARQQLLDEFSRDYKPIGTPPTDLSTDTNSNQAPEPIDSGDLYKSLTGA